MGSTITLAGSLAGFTDSAFVLLVMFACWRALSGSTNSGNTKRWKQELSVLESSLRDIVSEATIASGTLDKQLMRRQEDLELLLRRIEKAQVNFAELRHQDNPDQSRAVGRAQHQASRLPANEPGRFKDDAATSPTDKYLDSERSPVDFNDSTFTDEDEDLPNPTWRKRQPTVPQAAPPLRQQIEMVRANDSARAERELLRTIDPVALRVAERLLQSGQKIHVVARKLELSIAQVRAIDARRIQNSETSAERSMQQTSINEAPIGKTIADIPWTIDRETALL